MTTSAGPKSKNDRHNLTFANLLPWLLLVCGLIGLIASLMLTIEVFQRLKDSQFEPICNLNPIFSCTSVADSPQSHLFGFPNYFLGIAGYAAMATVGVVLLAGAKLKKWFWQLVELGLLFAILFLSWLQYSAIYRIGALCLFCMIVWVVTIPAFWYTTLYNFRVGNLATPAKLRGVVGFAYRHHGDILIAWYLVLIGLILKRFWYYWSSLV